MLPNHQHFRIFLLKKHHTPNREDPLGPFYPRFHFCPQPVSACLQGFQQRTPKYPDGLNVDNRLPEIFHGIHQIDRKFDIPAMRLFP